MDASSPDEPAAGGRRDVGHQYARRLGYLEFAVEWAIRQSPAQDPIEELRRTWHEYQSRTDW